MFVAISDAGGPFGSDPEYLTTAFDAFFENFARRFPHTNAVLLLSGDTQVERLAASRAQTCGAHVMRVPRERFGEPGSWEAFIEKHCPLVLAAAVQHVENVGKKSQAHTPLRIPLNAPGISGPVLPERDAVLETLAEIDAWNADAAGSCAFDETLCAQTFARADTMAVRAQRHTNRAVNRVFWFTVSSGLSLQIYDHLADFVPAWTNAATPFSLVFVAFILAAVLTVRRLHAAEVQRAFGDRRSLAEGLRVQGALLEAGIDIDVADRYPAEAGEGIEWIRRSIDAAYLASTLAMKRDSGAAEARPTSVVRPAWIVEQCSYYESASSAHRAAAQRSNRIAVGWLRLSIVAAVFIAIDGFARLTTHAGIGHFLAGADRYSKPALLMTLAVAGSLAALTKGKTALRGHRALADRYAAMHETFASAARALDDLDARSPRDASRATAIIVNLAHETLAENAAWHESMRNRPLQTIWSS